MHHLTHMNKIVKIGTRDSKLAVWQASKVQQQLATVGIESVLVKVKSEGDLDLVTPLYAMGVEGVFTKTLDAYLLSKKIDIAVHSMKDVPIQLAEGITQAAILPRGNYKDVLMFKNKERIAPILSLDKTSNHTIATGSVRRKAALLYHFPQLQVAHLRGNVQTRIQKLNQSNWDAAIFAAAGLERVQERTEQTIDIDWMLPAPAQGAIMVVCHKDNKAMIDICQAMNDATTAICTKIERDFLKTLMGGCSTPIGALATIKDNTIYFQGELYDIHGKEKMEISLTTSLTSNSTIGIEAANSLLQQGAERIISKIKP